MFAVRNSWLYVSLKNLISSNVICNICEYIFSFIGQGGKLVDRGDNTYGGKWVINPSGGLISKGHPLGATGNAAQSSHTVCYHLA